MSSGGQVAGGVLGAVAGFIYGGPTGAKYGAQIGMLIGGYLDPPKGPTVNGPRLDDLTVQTSTYGAVIARLHGTTSVRGNAFWLENNSLLEKVTKKKSGGKGGGAKTTTRTYTYSATFAVGLCKGPIAGVRRIWVGPNLIYDAGSTDFDTITASNASAEGFKIYLGTDTQLPDPRIQATLGVANTPAWRGLAYIVFYDLQLEKYGNSLMGAQVKVEVMQSAAIYTYPYSTFTMPTDRDYTVPVHDGAVWCVASSSKYVTTSSDGLAWTEYEISPAAINYKTFLSSDGAGTMLVADGNAGVMWRSTDHGVSWALVPITTSYSLNDAKWNGSEFLLIEDSWGGSFHRSSNGLGWTTETPRPGGDIWPQSYFARTLIWHPQTAKWYIFCNGNRTIYASPSGIGGTWVSVYTAEATANNFTFSCLHKGRLLFSGSGTTGGLYQPAMIWSDDGATWTQSAMPIRGQMTSDGSNLWIVANRDVRYSEDGVTSWTVYVPPAQGETNTYYGCAAGAFIVYAPCEGQYGFRVTRQFVSPGMTPLSDIVSDECLLSGLLTGGDIDVTALLSEVRGYIVGSIGSIRSALEPLQAAWPFDVVQHGYQIKFIPRGGASVVTIPASDLDARSDGNAAGVQLTTNREMDSQLPRRVTVQHLDYDREYDAGTQYAERLNTTSVNSLILDLPIVLTADEAAGKAEVLLYVYWLERYDLSFNLPPTYNQLEVVDVVTLDMPEGTSQLRLTSVTNSSDGRVECRAKRADEAIYTPTAVGVVSAVTGPTTITPVGASVYVLMDLPEISVAQNTPCFLVAMTGALAGWDGGVLMQSTDAGSTWASLQDFGAPGCTMGTASATIAAVDTGIMDNASVLTVTLTQGVLSSVTQLALFSGANHFAYGVNGRWEIIAAKTCTLVSGSTYTLSDFLRGRFGTEQYMGTHVAGDSIVLLDTVDVALIAMGVGTIGLSYLYRGITYNRDIGTDNDRAFAYSAVNLKPLAPIYLTGNRDSSNDWVLTWIRRTRDGGEWRDNVDAALGEVSEAYQIDVFSDGTYTTVKRTIATILPTAAYASADQVTDFGSNQGTLYLKLYQISAAVGRGYALTTSIAR